jgi:hypothetical protein
MLLRLLFLKQWKHHILFSTQVILKIIGETASDIIKSVYINTNQRLRKSESTEPFLSEQEIAEILGILFLARVGSFN